MPCSLLEALSKFEVYIRTASDEQVLQNLSVLWPHRLFSTLFHRHKQAFMDKLCNGSVECIRDFWKTQTRHPAYSDHPMHTHPRCDYRTHGIPLAFHADGVTVVGVGKKLQKHMDCISWASLLSPSTCTRTSYFVILFIFQLMQLRGASVIIQ